MPIFVSAQALKAPSETLYVGADIGFPVPLFKPVEPQEFVKIFPHESSFLTHSPELNYELRYHGISMKDFFNKMWNLKLDPKGSTLSGIPINPSDYFVIIAAWDRYMPVLPLSFFLEDEALLAVRDTNSDPSKPRSRDDRWTMISDQKTGHLKSPGPFYLTWKTNKFYFWSGWPYQVRGVFLAPKKGYEKTYNIAKLLHNSGLFKYSVSFDDLFLCNEKYICEIYIDPDIKKPIHEKPRHQ